MALFLYWWFLRRFTLLCIELIFWPSWGAFLLDVGARATGSAGSLRLTVLRLLKGDRDRARAGRSPAKFSPAAQLFTSSLRLACATAECSARLCITARLISAKRGDGAESALREIFIRVHS